MHTSPDTLTPSVFLCPVCGKALRSETRLFRCDDGHSFDVSKDGYLNLLLSHHRKSNHPGDGVDMLKARRRFFESGAFQPVFAAVKRFIPEHSRRVLDAGCGEGTFLGRVSEDKTGCFCGLDVSKDAVRLAAKRYPGRHWAVANLMRKIPLADNSMDTILSILAPRNPAEFRRILVPEGVLVCGVPGPDHLIELRSSLNNEPTDFRSRADETVAKCAPDFIEKDRQAVSCQAVLGQQQLADLIRMTPIFWTSGRRVKKAVMQLPELAVTISFVLIRLA